MITFVNLMCKGNTISPTTQFVEAEFTKEGTATLPPLPPTFLPQEKIFAKNSPTLPIYNKVGREREGGKKRGKERFFTKKQDFANFCWDYIKEYWKKRSIFAT